MDQYGIIFVSIVLLFAQMAIEHNHSVSWMTAHRTQMSMFNWIDLILTLYFIIEFCLQNYIGTSKNGSLLRIVSSIF